MLCFSFFFLFRLIFLLHLPSYYNTDSSSPNTRVLPNIYTKKYPRGPTINSPNRPIKTVTAGGKSIAVNTRGTV